LLLSLATLHLARARTRLRRRPFSEVIGRAALRREKAEERDFERELANRIGWAINVAAKYVPWNANCLVKALAATALLRRYGFEPAIRIGVRREGAEFAAHAWVVCDGATIVGAHQGAFTPMRQTHGERAAPQTNMPSWI
jgi:hypothetical protein